MADVDPFTPGPDFQELAQQKLGGRLISLPIEKVAPDGTVIAPNTPLTVEQWSQLGVTIAIGNVE